ncbi:MULTISPECIES: hypothetical protein [Pseudomonas]|uniref:hypothetical protein n=1 Tax=Pseudomonas TaxID=286 RepID=UPI001E305A82|nr:MULTISPECIES: hypothetical protein [Pseudomonas]EKX5229364.1 hypothetical protein [Pseudomonas aeruginosa]MCE0911293.1 hypothetical protein [Pseudomonas kurunegalensis]MDH0300506.1 hypothetical protein [Pseudomonas sp. GD04091]MDH1987951.1 hypothetical protein [Pseudomonas sp. GD03689]WJR57225.1 hypothetical protein LU664_006555 [Pseudomonas kurunegalensis]
MNKAEQAGKIGGLVGGFKRRERQKFLVAFIKLVEMEEFPDLKLTSCLAKKLIAAFSGCKSISNDVLIKEFGRPGNKVKQQNLDDIVLILTERYSETYKSLWSDAKKKIEDDANEYKKQKIQEMRTSIS